MVVLNWVQNITGALCSCAWLLKRVEWPRKQANIPLQFFPSIWNMSEIPSGYLEMISFPSHITNIRQLFVSTSFLSTYSEDARVHSWTSPSYGCSRGRSDVHAHGAHGVRYGSAHDEQALFLPLALAQTAPQPSGLGPQYWATSCQLSEHWDQYIYALVLVLSWSPPHWLLPWALT